MVGCQLLEERRAADCPRTRRGTVKLRHVKVERRPARPGQATYLVPNAALAHTPTLLPERSADPDLPGLDQVKTIISPAGQFALDRLVQRSAAEAFPRGRDWPSVMAFNDGTDEMTTMPGIVIPDCYHPRSRDSECVRNV